MPGDGFLYFALRPPWVKARPTADTFYVLHPEARPRAARTAHVQNRCWVKQRAWCGACWSALSATGAAYALQEKLFASKREQIFQTTNIPARAAAKAASAAAKKDKEEAGGAHQAAEEESKPLISAIGQSILDASARGRHGSNTASQGVANHQQAVA